MALPDYRIKKIYLGTDLIRPIIKEYTYSFIDKSVTTLQADWWEFWRNSWTATSWWQFTSNWLHNTETSENTKRASIWINHWLDFSNANKITITVNHYLVSWSWNWASSYGIRDWMNSSGTFGVWGDIYSMNNSGYNGYSVFCTDSTTIWNRTTLSTWNYVWQTVIDLVNKTVVTKLTGQSDLSLSLSDAQITSIRWCQYIRIYYDNVGNYYKDISIKWE